MLECVKTMKLFMVFPPFFVVSKYSIKDIYYINNSKIIMRTKTKM